MAQRCNAALAGRRATGEPVGWRTWPNLGTGLLLLLLLLPLPLLPLPLLPLLSAITAVTQPLPLLMPLPLPPLPEPFTLLKTVLLM